MIETKNYRIELIELLKESQIYFDKNYLKGDSSFANWCIKEANKIKKYHLSSNPGALIFLTGLGLETCSEFILNYQALTSPGENKQKILEYYGNAILSTENSEKVSLIE